MCDMTHLCVTRLDLCRAKCDDSLREGERESAGRERECTRFYRLGTGDAFLSLSLSLSFSLSLYLSLSRARAFSLSPAVALALDLAPSRSLSLFLISLCRAKYDGSSSLCCAVRDGGRHTTYTHTYTHTSTCWGYKKNRVDIDASPRQMKRVTKR